MFISLYHNIIALSTIQNGPSHNPFTKFEVDLEEDIVNNDGHDNEESVDNYLYA